MNKDRKEYLKNYNRKHYLEHKEEILKKQKEYRIKNKEKVSERHRKYNQKIKAGNIILTELEEILRTTYEFYKNKDSKYEEVLKKVIDLIQELKEKYK